MSGFKQSRPLLPQRYAPPLHTEALTPLPVTAPTDPKFESHRSRGSALPVAADADDDEYRAHAHAHSEPHSDALTATEEVEEEEDDQQDQPVRWETACHAAELAPLRNKLEQLEQLHAEMLEHSNVFDEEDVRQVTECWAQTRAEMTAVMRQVLDQRQTILGRHDHLFDTCPELMQTLVQRQTAMNQLLQEHEQQLNDEEQQHAQQLEAFRAAGGSSSDPQVLQAEQCEDEEAEAEAEAEHEDELAPVARQRSCMVRTSSSHGGRTTGSASVPAVAAAAATRAAPAS